MSPVGGRERSGVEQRRPQRGDLELDRPGADDESDRRGGAPPDPAGGRIVRRARRRRRTRLCERSGLAQQRSRVTAPGRQEPLRTRGRDRLNAPLRRRYLRPPGRPRGCGPSRGGLGGLCTPATARDSPVGRAHGDLVVRRGFQRPGRRDPDRPGRDHHGHDHDRIRAEQHRWRDARSNPRRPGV